MRNIAVKSVTFGKKYSHSHYKNEPAMEANCSAMVKAIVDGSPQKIYV
jgi:hypothetical protein